MNAVAVRVVTTLVAAAAGGGITWLVHPFWDPGMRSATAIVLSAGVNAMIAQVLLVQPLLGYWVQEDSDERVPMTAKQRSLMLAIGVVVVIVSALLFPLIDRHSGSDNI